VAIVTGGSRAIGGAVARKLAIGETTRLSSTNLNGQHAADAAVEEILAANVCAVAVRADVADELDVERSFSETIEAFGGVDVVVHAAARKNAGTVAAATSRRSICAAPGQRAGTFVVSAGQRIQRGKARC